MTNDTPSDTITPVPTHTLDATNAPNQGETYALVRYGAMGEVAKFAVTIAGLEPHQSVVVETPRGTQLGTIVATLPISQSPSDLPAIVRTATTQDLQRVTQLRDDSQNIFHEWQERIRDWEIDLQLIDIEQTLGDSKLILYVLNDRGADTTKLALRAAAAGFGVIEVQPVGAEGILQPIPSGGGGCGSCRTKHS